MLDRWVDVNVLWIEKETPDAFLAVLANPEVDTIWIPKSVIADPENYEEGDMECLFHVAAWWAKKEDILDE